MSRRGRTLAALLACCGAVLAGCGGASSSATDAATDVGVDDGAATDAPAPSLRRCPQASDCFLLTPAESGLPATGVGAGVDQVALRPGSAARGRLLIFLNGSGGAPKTAVGSSAPNYYGVARAAGLHVLAVSYRSDDAIGVLCPPTSPTRDDCYEPTRATVLSGVYQPGAAADLAAITPDEGVYARVAAALATLAAGDPGGGWEAFVDLAAASAPEQAIRWPAVFASGTSQGGGHAALLGKLHAVDRVVMLSSPCDAVGSAPATWLTRSAAFQTAAAGFLGLGATADTTCPVHAAAWTALGMAPAQGDDTAVVCAGETGHSAPIRCSENASKWEAMLQ